MLRVASVLVKSRVSSLPVREFTSSAMPAILSLFVVAMRISVCFPHSCNTSEAADGFVDPLFIVVWIDGD